MTDSTSFLKSLDAGRILDVATGGGSFLKYLTDHVGDYSEAIGIDKKESAAAAFEETFQQNCRAHFQVMDAENLEFSDATLDTICISNSLHHLESPEKVLQEMMRVLKPGGVIILSEMYRDGDQLPAQQTHIQLHHWMASIDRSQNIIHNDTYTRQEHMGLFGELDLEQILQEDQADLGGDPVSAEILDELEPIIQRYLDRTNESSTLHEQGKKLLARLHKIGFYNASSLLIIFKKKR